MCAKVLKKMNKLAQRVIKSGKIRFFLCRPDAGHGTWLTEKVNAILRKKPLLIKKNMKKNLRNAVFSNICDKFALVF